jgi:hypothetical protein
MLFVAQVTSPASVAAPFPPTPFLEKPVVAETTFLKLDLLPSSTVDPPENDLVRLIGLISLLAAVQSRGGCGLWLEY